MPLYQCKNVIVMSPGSIQTSILPYVINRWISNNWFQTSILPYVINRWISNNWFQKQNE